MQLRASWPQQPLFITFTFCPLFPLFPGLSGAGPLPHLDTNCSDQGPSETGMAAVSFRSLLWRHCFLTISYCCVFLSFGMGVAFLGPTLLDLGKKGFVCIQPLTQKPSPPRTVFHLPPLVHHSMRRLSRPLCQTISMDHIFHESLAFRALIRFFCLIPCLPSFDFPSSDSAGCPETIIPKLICRLNDCHHLLIFLLLIMIRQGCRTGNAFTTMSWVFFSQTLFILVGSASGGWLASRYWPFHH
jgi:hypothetical protein